MSALATWLASIGMEKYLDVLESDSVDLDIIDQLTDSDLAGLGIRLGDRKRLLSAIRATGNEASAVYPTGFEEASAEFGGDPARAGRSIGELRQMTIMFVDLVNSTGLVQDMGIEKYRDALKAYQNCNIRAIRDNFGYFAQFIGDGVVAYFGFPLANEDDAERSVLTAQAIIKDVGAISVEPDTRLSVRVGIATGDVLIEDLMHSSKQADSFALGNIPNLAARLQSLAEPGQIMISERTRRLLGSNFRCTSIGEKQLKGFSDPLGVWRVEGSENTELRFDKRRTSALTPLIGRDDEFNLLRGRWDAVLRGEGQAVFLSGEAGLGKSRLAEEVYRQLVSPDGTRLVFQCSPYHQNSSFYPIKTHLNYAIGLTDNDTSQDRAQKLEDFVTENFGNSSGTLGILTAFLGDGASGQQETVAPEEFKGRIIETLIHFAENLSDEQPVFLLFEDLHWIDPSSEELLNILIDRLGERKVMLLGTYRPEYVPRWSMRAKVTTLSLPGLGPRESKALLSTLNTSEIALNGLSKIIVRRSEGIPLFIEEMASMLSSAASDDWNIGDAEHEALFPSNLKDLLRVRLDHLDVTPDTISICAALGRNFTTRLVAAVSDRPEPEIQTELDSLVQAQILVQQNQWAENTFSFRHALISEVAYDAILPQRARQLHQRIAETLVRGFPRLCGRHPEILAMHYQKAGQFTAARDKWQEAGTLCISNYASREAIAHLTAALDANDHVAGDENSDRTEIELRQNLAVALEMRGWGSPDIATNLEKLIALNEKSGETALAFSNLHHLVGEYLIAGRPDVAWEYCKRTEELVGSDADPAWLTLSEHSSGMASLLLGEFDRAIIHFDKALLWRSKSDLGEINRYYSADPETIDIVMRCWAGALKHGDSAKIADELEEAVAKAEAQTSEFTRCYALSIIATIYCVLDNPVQSRVFARMAHKISEKIEFLYWEAWTSVVLGWAEARCGASDKGIATLRAGLERYVATGSGQIIAFSHTLLADAYLHAKEPEEAAVQIGEARSVLEGSAIRFHDRITEAVSQAIETQKSA
ncbi:adenylate/guanylate cyclase domain-containing protein [uncultured Roseobacter sp.]|uniref:adenylate/guanylate cyclase domain-containing protein n=1 Tax=uncultured Roseobacter sp. TaxID=114847 RepID=UPI002638C497|nr:adenylate/guanylate cyclase domain-containing protein [uncultured Roseobacter sp.]